MMIIVYGADWCEDTRRSRRHLRRLCVPHRYLNIDEDLEALDRARSLNGGVRRTPTIDLGTGGPALVEPANDTLTKALIDADLLSASDAAERLAVQNVGDLERAGRAFAGLALIGAGSLAPRFLRWPLRLAGAVVALTGVTGWCPAYNAAGVSSLGGPGDRPEESTRASWLAPVADSQPAGDSAEASS